MKPSPPGAYNVITKQLGSQETFRERNRRHLCRIVNKMLKEERDYMLRSEKGNTKIQGPDRDPYPPGRLFDRKKSFKTQVFLDSHYVSETCPLHEIEVALCGKGLE